MPDGWYSLKTPYRTEKRLRDERVQKTICGTSNHGKSGSITDPTKGKASSQLSIPQDKTPPKNKKPNKKPQKTTQAPSPFYEVQQRILKRHFLTQSRKVKFTTYHMVSLMPDRQLKLCAHKVIKVRGPQGQQTHINQNLLGLLDVTQKPNNKPSSMQNCTFSLSFQPKDIVEKCHQREIKTNLGEFNPSRTYLLLENLWCSQNRGYCTPELQVCWAGNNSHLLALNPTDTNIGHWHEYIIFCNTNSITGQNT